MQKIPLVNCWTIFRYSSYKLHHRFFVFFSYYENAISLRTPPPPWRWNNEQSLFVYENSLTHCLCASWCSLLHKTNQLLWILNKFYFWFYSERRWFWVVNALKKMRNSHWILIVHLNCIVVGKNQDNCNSWRREKKRKKTYSNCRPQNSTQFFPAKAFSRREWCFSLSLSQGPRDWRPPGLQDLDTSPLRTVDHHIRDDCKDLNWNFKPCYNPVWTRRKFNFSVLTSTQERKPIEDKKIKWLCKICN